MRYAAMYGKNWSRQAFVARSHQYVQQARLTSLQIKVDNAKLAHTKAVEACVVAEMQVAEYDPHKQAATNTVYGSKWNVVEENYKLSDLKAAQTAVVSTKQLSRQISQQDRVKKEQEKTEKFAERTRKQAFFYAQKAVLQLK